MKTHFTVKYHNLVSLAYCGFNLCLEITRLIHEERLAMSNHEITQIMHFAVTMYGMKYRKCQIWSLRMLICCLKNSQTTFNLSTLMSGLLNMHGFLIKVTTVKKSWMNLIRGFRWLVKFFSILASTESLVTAFYFFLACNVFFWHHRKPGK